MVRVSPAEKAKLFPGKVRTGLNGEKWVSEKRGKTKFYRWYRFNPQASKSSVASQVKKNTTKKKYTSKSSPEHPLTTGKQHEEKNEKRTKKSTPKKQPTNAKSISFKLSEVGTKLFGKLRDLEVKDKFVQFEVRQTTSGGGFRMMLTFSPVPAGYNCQRGVKGCPRWNDIKCTNEYNIGTLKVKTSCLSTDGTRFANPELHRASKVFVKGFQNFGDYIDGLQTGRIEVSEHRQLWTEMLNNLMFFNKQRWNHGGYTLFNHNLDVNTLHFKFKPLN